MPGALGGPIPPAKTITGSQNGGGVTGYIGAFGFNVGAVIYNGIVGTLNGVINATTGSTTGATAGAAKLGAGAKVSNPAGGALGLLPGEAGKAISIPTPLGIPQAAKKTWGLIPGDLGAPPPQQ